MKINVIFQSLKRSEFIISLVNDRISHILSKFPERTVSKALVVVEMNNSPLKPGPDQFKVKAILTGKRLGKTVIVKTSQNLYEALAMVTDRLVDIINRQTDKRRVRNRNQQRKLIESGF